MFLIQEPADDRIKLMVEDFISQERVSFASPYQPAHFNIQEMSITGALPKLRHLGNFACFCCLLIFFKINFFDSGILLVSNSLDPDQARYFVGPGVGPNSVCKGYEQMALVGKELE